MTNEELIKEIPILFSSPMVQAILRGDKTQTRRGLKPQPQRDSQHPWTWNPKRVHGNPFYFSGSTEHLIEILTAPELGICPYGKPGDLLYVRETHYRFGHWEPIPGKETKGGRQKWQFVEDRAEVLYDAPETFRKGMHNADPWTPAWHKRNSLFMPKEAARIWLEVESVRVERLQDISEGDAVAEGIEKVNVNHDVEPEYKDYHGVPLCRVGDKHPWGLTPYGSFKSLWQSINGAESWAANLWVWAVTFKMVSTTGKPLPAIDTPQLTQLPLHKL